MFKMCETDGHVPENLREELQGLQSNRNDDVANQPEDDNPEQYAGDVIEEGDDDGMEGSEESEPTPS